MYVVSIVNVFYSGEKKLGKVITPDTWKDGARNTTGEVRTQIYAWFWISIIIKEM